MHFTVIKAELWILDIGDEIQTLQSKNTTTAITRYQNRSECHTPGCNHRDTLFVAEMKRQGIDDHYCNNYFNKHGVVFCVFFSCFLSCLVFIFVMIDQKLTHVSYYNVLYKQDFQKCFGMFGHPTSAVSTQTVTERPIWICTYSEIAMTKTNLANIFICKFAAKRYRTY